MTTLSNSELIEFCQDIIRSPSLSGQEKDVADKIAAKMRQLCYDEVIVDEFGSVVGMVKGQSSRPAILFDGHIDTVPVSAPNRWSHLPFGAEIENNKIYGRGASDMKGAVAAMIYGIASLIPIKRQIHGTIYVSCTVFEERFEGIALGRVLDLYPADYVVIGEPSELNLMIGQKGRAEIIVKTLGRNAHSSTPQLGINAIYKMIPIIEGIKSIKLPRHRTLGQAVLELTDIISKPYPGASVVPDMCQITYDRRLLAGESKQGVLACITDVASALQKKDAELQFIMEYFCGEDVCYTGAKIAAAGYFPAWLAPEDSMFVEKASAALRDIGLMAKQTTWEFCTNGSESAGVRDMPTIGFGPGSPAQAHVDDEYIELAQLLKSAEGYAAIARAMLS